MSTRHPHNHNPNAYRFVSLTYDSLGGGVLARHIRLDHRDGEYPEKPVHVPADRAGVAP